MHVGECRTHKNPELYEPQFLVLAGSPRELVVKRVVLRYQSWRALPVVVHSMPGYGKLPRGDDTLLRELQEHVRHLPVR